MGSADNSADNPELNSIELHQDHMVDHPAGAHYALWNGPAFLDIGVPGGSFVRFAVATLPAQWTLLMDGHGEPLPVAARSDGRTVSVWWLPYDGPGAHQAPQRAGGMTDADNATALQRLATTRYQGLMDAAWGIGGWSTYRRR